MKLRLLGIFFLIIAVAPKVLWACSVCFGNPDSQTTQAAKAGILFLLGVTTIVLTGFGWTFLTWVHRAKAIGPHESTPPH